MSYTIPTTEPTGFTAGDSLQWDRTLAAYPPSEGWTLSYVLTGAGAAVIEVAASPSDDNTSYEVRVTPATTADYTPGRYNLVGLVTHTDGRRFEVYRAACVVLADPATATPTLSYNERMLAAVEAKLEARIVADISSYTLEQQQVYREEMLKLQAQRNSFAEAVRRERGGAFFQNVGVSFGVPA